MASKLDEVSDDGPLASINIIPFVDIALVLLVIFMITSATIVRASLKVELPKAASGGSPVESTINLLYTKAGEFTLNGEKMPSFAQAAGDHPARGHRQPEAAGRDLRRQGRRIRQGRRDHRSRETKRRRRVRSRHRARNAARRSRANTLTAEL